MAAAEREETLWFTWTMRVVRTVQSCFTIWTYLLIAPLASLGFLVATWVMPGDRAARARRLQRVIAWGYRFQHGWLSFVGMLRVHPARRIEGVPEGACVVVANHPTLTDITAITALLDGACTIVKSELYHRRMLHRMLASTGHIEGAGATMDQERTRASIDEAVTWLDDGFRLVVFPEGTRSVNGRLGRFGRTSFEIACRAKVPVVLLGITSDPPYLTKEVSMYRPPLRTSHLRIRLLGVIHPNSVEGDSRRLCRVVRERYTDEEARRRAEGAGGGPIGPQ